jgi:ribonuclease P protein component
MRRIHRLRDKDIQMVLRRGRRVTSPLFRVVARENKYSYSRFAFVASRAVDKRAVKRNLLRRRAREWIRKQPALVRLSYDMVIIFTKGAVQAPKKHFYEELDTVYRKIAH